MEGPSSSSEDDSSDIGDSARASESNPTDLAITGVILRLYFGRVYGTELFRRA